MDDQQEGGTPDTRQAGPPRAGRDGNGKFARNPETADLDARAAQLKIRGLSYRQIARELGYADHSSARAAVARARADVVREPAMELVGIELERLDLLVQRANDVLDAVHYVTSSKGDVVLWEDEPLVDDAPIIAAINTLVKVSESRRKLLGLDAETKVNLSGGVKYELVGVDPAEILGTVPDGA